MEKIIMIKYGELTTKKGNIGLFLNSLKKNIEYSLIDENINIEFDKGRMFVFCNSDNFDSVTLKLQKIFGIHEIAIGYKMEKSDLDTVLNNVLKLLKEKEFKTFKVITKRSDKTYPIKSIDFSRKLGELILENTNNTTVDIHFPEVTIYIEIRVNNIYVYFENLPGLGGYPVGALGKGLLMLSGGIDSPVAGYLTIKRGVKLECVYFESPPHTSSEARNKVITLVKKLALYNGETKLHIICLTEIQESIYKNIPHEYLITILRRFMYRISELIAKNNRSHILINGESIGQVASQTLTSMEVINKVVTMPVIRPVSCFDKNEIITLARKIDTYETSILPYPDCCTIFVPQHPVINPDIHKVIEFEKLIPGDDMIYRAYKHHEVIKIDKDYTEHSDLL